MEPLLAAVIVGVLTDFIVVAALIIASVRMVAGFWPTFPKALLCSTLLFFLSLIVTTAMQTVVGKGNGFAPTSGVMLVLSAVVVNGLIKRPDGTSIGLAMAALASLIQLIAEILVIVLVVIGFGFSLLVALNSV